jgi:anti-sigma B factor antagonist
VFTLDVHHDDRCRLLRPRGELDLHTCQLFRERLTDLVREEGPRLVLDLSDLDFIDSSGLAVILTLLRVAEDRRPRIVLSPSNGAVSRLLRTTRLDLLLPIHASIEAAVGGSVPVGSAV